MSPRRLSVVLMIAGLGLLGTWRSPDVMTRAVAAPTKIAEAGESEEPPAPDAVAPAQAVLYEEVANDPSGRSVTGSAVWRTTNGARAGQSPETAVEAEIRIPARSMSVLCTFRHITDPSLPASHTIEIQFKSASNRPGDGIANVPGVLMKTSERARGVPLAGLTVKVVDGYYLVGLSNVAAERDNNIKLLKGWPWLDIPIVYASKQRAILAVEKGESGQRAFASAFEIWDQEPVNSRQ